MCATYSKISSRPAFSHSLTSSSSATVQHASLRFTPLSEYIFLTCITRHLIPRAPTKFSACLLFLHPTPLFEEKRHTRIVALVTNVEHPCRIHRPSARTGFASNDHPIYFLQVEVWYRTKKWLDGKKLDMRACFAKVVDTVDIIAILHGHTHPDIFRPRKITTHFKKPVCAFRQNLICVPVSSSHYAECFLDEVFRHLMMKQVTHGIDKDHLRFLPKQRSFNNLIMYRNFETILIAFRSHQVQPVRHSFGIAIDASGRYLGTAGNGVPRRLGPFYSRILRHLIRPL